MFADGVGVLTFKMGRRRFDASGSGESSWRKFGVGSCVEGLRRNEKVLRVAAARIAKSQL